MWRTGQRVVCDPDPRDCPHIARRIASDRPLATLPARSDSLILVRRTVHKGRYSEGGHFE